MVWRISRNNIEASFFDYSGETHSSRELLSA
jgi:hypothetical protein